MMLLIQVTCFNRTTVELKYRIAYTELWSIIGFNRTTVELK